MAVVKHIIPNFFALLLFSAVTYDMYADVPKFLFSHSFSATEFEQIQITKLVGYIISGFLLSQIIHLFSTRNILISSVAILILSVLSLIFVSEYQYVRLIYIIIAAGNLTYIITALVEFIELSWQKPHIAFIMFFIAWIIGHFISDYTDFPIDQDFAINAISYSLIIYIIILLLLVSKPSIRPPKLQNSNFGFLLQNIELQLVSGFTITYLAIDILWYYPVFATTEQLLISNITTTMCYMFKAIIIFIAPMTILFTKLNKYLLNLLLMIVLFLCFLFLSILADTFLYNLIIISLIGLCLCGLFVCDIMILFDKFTLQDFKTSLVLYFSASSIGAYSGVLSSNITYQFIKTNYFLFSAFSVMTSFLLYYIWYFKKHKLGVKLQR